MGGADEVLARKVLERDARGTFCLTELVGRMDLQRQSEIDKLLAKKRIVDFVLGENRGMLKLFRRA